MGGDGGLSELLNKNELSIFQEDTISCPVIALARPGQHSPKRASASLKDHAEHKCLKGSIEGFDAFVVLFKTVLGTVLEN